jgi:EAL domain-containing protein (putative c-di-GMP-specific phosphodiesterase class I)
MTTIAEGVETEAQLARVRADGCTDVQGYLISRPLAPELIDEFLRTRTESATAPVAA